MSRVLVVDDEKSYREYLSRFLSRAAHEVRVAESGCEAIEIGARFRPDVLVVDWMLKNHVHGLHVAEALGTVRPDLATIMITGFPSGDLKAAAERARVYRFIEKPFEVEEIQDAVREGARRELPRGAGPRLAVVDVDGQGRILYANPAARDLFTESVASRDATAFADLFQPGAVPQPEAAARAWTAAVPRSERPRLWYARTHAPRPDLSQLWILRRHDERANPPLTEMLLGVEEPLLLRWPYESRVLVVDDDELFRHVACAILRSAGAACYSAETEGEALRLLEHDEGIRVVILDHEIPGIGLVSLLERIRALRPGIQLLGNSAFDRREEFAELGVERFLRKPWRASDVVELIEA